MSNLTQFAPFASGGLKSFQTGYFSTGSTVAGSGEDARYFDVTISSVVVAKSITGFQGSAPPYTPGSNYYYDSANAQGIVTSRVTSTTNIRIANAVNHQFMVGRWQVAEAN
jgi:hypothetical protein